MIGNKRKISIFLATFFALAIIAAGYFVYYDRNENIKSEDVSSPEMSGRDPQEITGSPQTDSPMDQKQKPDESAGSMDNQGETEKSDSPDTPPVNINDRNPADGKKKANITTRHCDDDCQAFAIDLQLFEYCQQVCGISPPAENSDCENRSGLQKDYCLKDQAVEKKDPTICRSIEDANIRQTCENRIAQEIFENQ